MPLRVFALIVAVALWSEPGIAHTTVVQSGTALGTASVVAVTTTGGETGVTVSVSPDGQGSTLVRVSRGTRLRLTLLGAGAGALHLHGYDITVEAEEGEPAVFVFDATATGRFPLEMHVEDDLLGEGEKALLYLEVREQ